ncbi:uncharacterized protein LOC117293728 [Asterias rubens]|uniref:uncharacterized protein LOC117293728 n=1 Tax=Asterias rubens TaxID=7604 RepID=UPI001454EFA2|nr:uncharacterized protein LOC117293728 [Asterias rubens]
MDNTATLVTGNTERTVSLSLSSAKERAAGKALMGLRNLKPDDIGMLRYTRASELETQVKCSNHAHDISSKKQVDLWHRDQRIAVGKLARGQQKMFRNLIRVQNDKRRIQRQARIRKQKEVQNELREKAVRDREEAQNRLRNMIMAEAMQQEEVPIKESILPVKSPLQLPEINEKPDMEFTMANEDLHSESDEQNERGKSSNHYMADDNSQVLTTEKQIPSTVTPSSSSSTSTSPHLPSHNQPSTTQVPSTIQQREESQILGEVSKANLPFIRTDTERSFVPDMGHLISKPHFSREAKNSSGNPKLLDLRASLRDKGEHDRLDVNPNKVLPGISSSTNRHSYPHPESGETFERKKFHDSVFDDDVMMTGRSTKEPRKDTKKRRKPSTELGELRDGKHKYHIGIANRSFRVPDYRAPVVTSVVRYERNSEGSLVPSEVAVKPAAEEYKLPSRRAEYMVEKALEWEKRREDVRQRKLQSFIGRMKEIERKEKLESRLAASLDSTRQTTSFHHHRQSHLLPKVRSPPPITHRRSTMGGESLEAYHIKGDVNDPKNCRYLRLSEEDAVPGGSEDHGRGKLGEATKKRGGRGSRRQSSWGLVGVPRGFTVAEKTHDTHIAHHHNVIT